MIKYILFTNIGFLAGIFFGVKIVDYIDKVINDKFKNDEEK